MKAADGSWVYSRALDDYIRLVTSQPEPRMQPRRTRRTLTLAGDRVIGSDAAIAVGRFRPEGPAGWRAKSIPGAPLRASRAEAIADEAAWWIARDESNERKAG